jgi:hypothetical protein
MLESFLASFQMAGSMVEPGAMSLSRVQKRPSVVDFDFMSQFREVSSVANSTEYLYHYAFLTLICLSSPLFHCFCTSLLLRTFLSSTLTSHHNHTKIFEDYNDYLWPVVAIWVFDRLLRLIRQAYLNLSLVSFTTTQTKSEFLESANLLILTVTLPAKRLNIKKPNTHFFLYQPFQ